MVVKLLASDNFLSLILLIPSNINYVALRYVCEFKHLSEVISKFQNQISLFLSIKLANTLDSLEQNINS